MSLKSSGRQLTAILALLLAALLAAQALRALSRPLSDDEYYGDSYGTTSYTDTSTAYSSGSTSTGGYWSYYDTYDPYSGYSWSTSSGSTSSSSVGSGYGKRNDLMDSSWSDSTSTVSSSSTTSSGGWLSSLTSSVAGVAQAVAGAVAGAASAVASAVSSVAQATASVASTIASAAGSTVQSVGSVLFSGLNTVIQATTGLNLDSSALMGTALPPGQRPKDGLLSTDILGVVLPTEGPTMVYSATYGFTFGNPRPNPPPSRIDNQPPPPVNQTKTDTGNGNNPPPPPPPPTPSNTGGSVQLTPPSGSAQQTTGIGTGSGGSPAYQQSPIYQQPPSPRQPQQPTTREPPSPVVPSQLSPPPSPPNNPQPSPPSSSPQAPSPSPLPPPSQPPRSLGAWAAWPGEGLPFWLSAGVNCIRVNRSAGEPQLQFYLVRVVNSSARPVLQAYWPNDSVCVRSPREHDALKAGWVTLRELEGRTVLGGPYANWTFVTITSADPELVHRAALSCAALLNGTCASQGRLLAYNITYTLANGTRLALTVYIAPPLISASNSVPDTATAEASLRSLRIYRDAPVVVGLSWSYAFGVEPVNRLQEAYFYVECLNARADQRGGSALLSLPLQAFIDRYGWNWNHTVCRVSLRWRGLGYAVSWRNVTLVQAAYLLVGIDQSRGYIALRPVYVENRTTLPDAAAGLAYAKLPDGSLIRGTWNPALQAFEWTLGSSALSVERAPGFNAVEFYYFPPPLPDTVVVFYPSRL